FQAEDGIRYDLVTGVQTCALPILPQARWLLRLGSARPDPGGGIPRRLCRPERRAGPIGPFHRLLRVRSGLFLRREQPDELVFGRSEERRVGKECGARLAVSCVMIW